MEIWVVKEEIVVFTILKAYMLTAYGVSNENL